MSTIMVNARVNAEDKMEADRVLAAQQRTWSQSIQALASYIRRTRSFPSVLDEPTIDVLEEQQHTHDILMGVCGISTSVEGLTDEAAARILFEETKRRHG